MPTSILCVPSTAEMSVHARGVTGRSSAPWVAAFWEVVSFPLKLSLGPPWGHLLSGLQVAASFNHRAYLIHFVFSVNLDWSLFLAHKEGSGEKPFQLGLTTAPSFLALRTHLIQAGGENSSRKSVDCMRAPFSVRTPATWSTCRWEKEWCHSMRFGD